MKTLTTRRTKMLVCRLLSAVLLVGLLTICGPQPGIPTASAADENVTITWLQFQVEYADPVQALARKYEEEHPGVTINAEVTGTHFDTLKAMLAAGDVPDIFMTEGYNNMRAYADYIEDLSGEPFVDEIVDAAKPCITLDGGIAGLPVTFQGEAIIYNKDIFAEYNLEVPTTYDELVSVVETLQANGVTPFTNQFKDDWLIGQFVGVAGYAYIPDTAQFTEERWAGNAAFAGNEQLLRNLDMFDYLLENGQDDPMNADWNEACASFAQGGSAMFFEGEWVWDSVKSVNPDINIGMFPVPVSNTAEENKIAVDVNGVWHVGKGSKHPEVAKDILNWIATSESAKQILLDEMQVIPVFEGWEYRGTNPLSADAYAALQADSVYQWPWPTWPDGFRVAAGKEYQEYILGTYADKEEVLVELDNIWDRLM